ncbi:MAG: bifunctional proline dehydrogenase/L-glutamate gamma-semialdehyde dehydrogenase PutA [Steroidobacteraceae bacterium]
MDHAASKGTDGVVQTPPIPAALQQRAALDETLTLQSLITTLEAAGYDVAAIGALAATALPAMRQALRAGLVNRMLNAYPLGCPEGLALLGLAEAWLRIPDDATRMQLLRDRLGAAAWQGGGWLGMGLRATQRLMRLCAPGAGGRACAPLLEPMARSAVNVALVRMARHYVYGADIAAALRRAQRATHAQRCHSFDMLGEAARTSMAAEHYRAAYFKAIEAVGASGAGRSLQQRDSVSIKLSALHCRYETGQRDAVVPELIGIVTELALAAQRHDIALTIDAEESGRLGMSLQILTALSRDARLRDWQGLGFAVQAYQRRAPLVIAWADELARAARRQLQVRLVKGAYWDGEIKLAQEQGLPDFPVYTSKAATDVAYLGCARRLLEATHLYPAFATHNAWSAATILRWARPEARFEFQRLHGMGEGLYETLLAGSERHCRVYAPVGPRSELLAYLVRRLLENGANGGFLQQLAAPAARGVAPAVLLTDPLACLRAAQVQPDARIANPMKLYGAQRVNSAGMDLGDPQVLQRLTAQIAVIDTRGVGAVPLLAGAMPAPADAERIQQALRSARSAQAGWEAGGVQARAQVLERAADLYQQHGDELIALIVREGRRNLPDAVSELREAVDFCRYYAAQARALLLPQVLPGPTGERNELWRAARGVFACISPWNFPLAIFTGQIAAALVSGNAVLAKPAPQTPLVAAAAVRLLHQAGVPPEVLHLLCGDAAVGARLTASAQVAGVAFTGSLPTARRIAASLFDSSAALRPLIAETGGLNAMLVDATALPEQVVGDVLTSAFQSAGQRCSALRLLCVQEEIAASLLAMLVGAMAELRIGDPARIDTDVGPVIDAAARERIEAHVQRHRTQVLYRCALPAQLPDGEFVAPTLIRLRDIEDLSEEIFGPVLHVVSWPAAEFESTLMRINALGYGLTMGLHTRIRERVQRVRALARVGNLYVNRSMIGAVVGTQPFGGEGLSGTGPKAGGPHYLDRFLAERTVSDNITATGGNVELLSL